MLLGAADDWTDPVPCQSLASRFPSLIELKTYANAYHDLDVVLAQAIPRAQPRCSSSRLFTSMI